MDASALASAESWLSLIATAKLVAAFLVAIGVAIEFGGDWVARPFEETVAIAREQQLAVLRTETARLSAEAETARAQIAQAQSETAKATLETERLRLEMRGRLVSRSQWETLERDLRGHDLSVHLTCLSEDQESRIYALSLSQALERVGVKDTRISPKMGDFFFGLKLEGPDGADFELLKSAFADAKIDFEPGSSPSLFIRVGNKPPTIRSNEMPMPEKFGPAPAAPRSPSPPP